MAQITFNFKDDGLEQNLAYFIKAEPIPIDFDGKPKYTPAQWWKVWVIMKTKQAIQKGKDKIESTKIDEDVIT